MINFVWGWSCCNFELYEWRKSVMKTRMIKWLPLVSLILLFSSTSCMRFFKHLTVPDYSDETLKQYVEEEKYLILHNDGQAWHLSEADIQENVLSARVDTNFGYNKKYLNPKDKGYNRFFKGVEPEVMNTVHLYTSAARISYSDTIIAMPVACIYKAKYNKYAKTISRLSWWLPAVIFPVGGIIILSVAVSGSGGLYGGGVNL